MNSFQISALVFILSFLSLVRAEDYYKFKHLKNLPPLEEGVIYGSKISRTMHLLSSSTKQFPNKVKILFFGQSITRQNRSRKIIEASLRKRFPHAQLEVLNTAIGGYQAPSSLKVMHHTLIPHQPDLIVFHVYGGEADGSYEQILKKIKTQTNAELICVTHHLDNYGEQIDLKKEAASELRRQLSEEYGAELVEVRKNWSRYMKMHKLPVTEFLLDRIHHNLHGGELWGALQERHFRVVKENPANWQDQITTIDLRKGEKSGKLGEISFDEAHWDLSKKLGLVSTSVKKPLKIKFSGRRVDVVSLKGNAEVDILVNGKKPSDYLSTWTATLPSATPIDYRPAINAIDLDGKPVAETWIATFDSVSEDGKSFSFHLEGSLSGPQGSGDHTKNFQSQNGIIKIDTKNFALAQAVQIKKKSIETPFSVRWSVENRSLDQWINKEDSRSVSGQVTLVQQLPSGEHVLEILPRKGQVQIEKILIYK